MLVYLLGLKGTLMYSHWNRIVFRHFCWWRALKKWICRKFEFCNFEDVFEVFGVESYFSSYYFLFRVPIAGIAGIIQLVSGPHLVVVNKKDKVGHLGSENHAVWRVVTSSLIPFSTSKIHLTPDERKLDLKQSQMVEDLLKEKHFYFSYTYDLTR